MELTTVAARRRVDKLQRVHIVDVPTRLLGDHRVDGERVSVVRGPVVARCGSILGGRILHADLSAVTCDACTTSPPDAWRTRLRARSG